jgi:hypothetical protein
MVFPWKRAKAEQAGAAEAVAELPRKVLKALDEAQITSRNHGEDPRFIIQFTGCRAFICGPDSMEGAIAGMWPELTEEQLQMAFEHMVRAVKAYARELRKINKTPWATRW